MSRVSLKIVEGNFKNLGNKHSLKRVETAISLKAKTKTLRTVPSYRSISKTIEDRTV